MYIEVCVWGGGGGGGYSVCVCVHVCVHVGKQVISEAQILPPPWLLQKSHPHTLTGGEELPSPLYQDSGEGG